MPRAIRKRDTREHPRDTRSTWRPFRTGDELANSTSNARGYSFAQGYYHPEESWTQAPRYPEPTRRIAVSQWAYGSYQDALRRAGARPVTITKQSLISDIETCDGLLIPGGRDVDPSWYGESNELSQLPDTERDALEIALIKIAMDKDMPVLGICRGHQLLNVAMGGSLIQHVNHHVTDKHNVTIISRSKHLSFIKDGQIYVNSLHHQAVDRLGTGLIATAFSDDDIIEAIESPRHKWVLGVQWHPEGSSTPRFNRVMDRLMRTFVNARSKELEVLDMEND